MLDWIFGLMHPFRYDLLGRLRCLSRRPQDPQALRPSGAEESAVETALELVCDAFFIPRRQRYQLRPEDELDWLYRVGYKLRFVDQMDFVNLYYWLEEACGRKLDLESELLSLRTIGDVIRLVATSRAAS